VVQAAALFNQHGFEGTSLAAFMAATGLEKGCDRARPILAAWKKRLQLCLKRVELGSAAIASTG
jgi:hypothetical protein